MTICKVEPNLIGEIIQNYWHPLLFKVKKPKNKAPRTECRSSYGWCGIRNLGCICYMNSMI
jgi:ubiquitin C-terminal hydrolase